MIFKCTYCEQEYDSTKVEHRDGYLGTICRACADNVISKPPFNSLSQQRDNEVWLATFHIDKE